MNLQTFMISLLQDDYQVVTAKNGKEAFTLIKAHRPEIAILDIQMPILTGLQVAKKCKDEVHFVLV